MASGRDWDPNHGDQEVYKLDTGREQWLNQQVPMLSGIVQMDRLWPHLIALGVLDKGQKDQIKLGAIGEEQVARLCDHLQKSPVWKWHAFLRCLILTDQDAVVTALKIDPIGYKEKAARVAPPPAAGSRLHTPSGLPASRTFKKLTPDDVGDLLKQHKVIILKKLDPNEILIAALIGANVIAANVENALQGATTTYNKNDIIVKAVERRGLPAFLNLCHVLCDREVDQGNIVEVMGLNIDDIEDQRTTLGR